MAFDPQPAQARGQPKSAEHRAKISAALRRYAQRPDSHLHGLHASGPAHPNFRGGIKPSFYRRVAFEAHGALCQVCGSTRNLNVHHRDGDRRNNVAENLAVLCRGCHSREHGLGGNVRGVTHCPQGHDYTAENTYVYVDKDGGQARSCRVCRRAQNRRWYARQKQEHADGL